MYIYLYSSFFTLCCPSLKNLVDANKNPFTNFVHNMFSIPDKIVGFNEV